VLRKTTARHLKFNFPADATDAADFRRLSARIRSTRGIGGEIHLEYKFNGFSGKTVAQLFSYARF
jgi:hypothetical protein